MAKVEIYINDKAYQIGCNEEDQPKLQECIDFLIRRIERFQKEDPVFFMGLNNERILLLQALTLVEELLGALKSNNSQSHSSTPAYNKDVLKAIYDSLSQSTRKVEIIKNMVDDTK